MGLDAYLRAGAVGIGLTIAGFIVLSGSHWLLRLVGEVLGKI